MAYSTFREGLWKTHSQRLWDIHALAAQALEEGIDHLQVLPPILVWMPLFHGWTSTILFRGSEAGSLQTSLRAVDRDLDASFFEVRATHRKEPTAAAWKATQLIYRETPSQEIGAALQALFVPTLWRDFADQYRWMAKRHLGPKEWAPGKTD